MSAVGPVDVAVGAAALLAAAVAVSVRDRLTAVVTFVLLGGLLALLWAGLAAPDVALAEAAIGTGVTGALFVDAVAGRRRAPAAPGGEQGDRSPGPRARPGRGAVATGVVAGLASAAFAAVLVRAVLAASGGGPPAALTGEVAGAMPHTATGHEVTAVLLDFRAYDTLLEVAVIVVAVVGAFALAAAAPAASAAPAAPAGAGPDAGQRTLRDFLRLASPVLLLLAAWLLFSGAYRPGGAFQGGAALAGVAILAAGAGADLRVLHGARGRWLVAVGPAAFLAAGAAGLLTAGHWLRMPAGWEEAATIAVETALAVSIGAGLALLFLAVRRDTVRIGDGDGP